MAEVNISWEQKQITELDCHLGYVQQSVGELARRHRFHLQRLIAIFGNLCDHMVACGPTGSELSDAIEERVRAPLRDLMAAVNQATNGEPPAARAVCNACQEAVDHFRAIEDFTGVIWTLCAACAAKGYRLKLTPVINSVAPLVDLVAPAEPAAPETPPAAHAACDEGGGDDAARNVADRYRGLVARAIAGLKNLGPFHYEPGDDPHALDCTLAGRVSRVFGLGMTLAIELCREFGQDPAYQEPHTIEEDEAQ